jgi:LemA protein
VVVERYPDLKATANFSNLQIQLEGSENRITVERQKFNEVVRDYNSSVRRAPAVFFAAALGFKERAYFTAAAGSDKPPQVKFDFGSEKH